MSVRLIEACCLFPPASAVRCLATRVTVFDSFGSFPLLYLFRLPEIDVLVVGMGGDSKDSFNFIIRKHPLIL